MRNIAERIKIAINNSGLKQSDVVAKTGISKSQISSYISGRYEPKSSNLIKLSRVLDVSVEWLACEELEVAEK